MTPLVPGSYLGWNDTEIAQIINVSGPGVVGTSRGKCMTQRVSPDRLHHHLSPSSGPGLLTQIINPLQNLVTSALCLALLLYTGRRV